MRTPPRRPPPAAQAGRRVRRRLRGPAAIVAAAWLCVWLGAAAQAQTIEAIRVEGNERIEAETVRSYLPVAPGDEADARAINRSLKSLFATGLFADVAIRREGAALIVSVVENPIVNRVVFEGNQTIEEGALEPEIQLRPREVYTHPRVRADVQRLTDIYRLSGRFAVRIEPKVVQLPQNRVDLVFEIDEGSVTDIRRIDFVGNERFDDGDLQDVIQTTESAWYRFFTSSDTYDPDRLAFDRELLRRFYLAEGYADFRVVSAVAELTREGNEFFITFSLEEGERYRIGAVDVESRLRDLDPATLRPALGVAPGDWYDADEVEETVQVLTETVGSRGYAFVDVVPRIERDREAGTLDVVFEIGEGARVYVDRIDIVGNTRTLDEVIRREFRLVEGDAFNSARIRRSRQRIQNLGFFAKVDIQTEEGDAPDRSVLTVEVDEAPTGELSFGAGVSSLDGFLGDIGVRERNLLGRGQELDLSLTVSERRQEVDLGFTEPYFLDRNVSVGFDVFGKTIDLQDESSFDRQTTGVVLRAGYPLAEHLRHAADYTFKVDDISNIAAGASRFIRRQEGETTTSALAHGLTYDLRDNRLAPTEGYFARLRQELAGLGGDVYFLRHSLSYGYFYSLWEGWVLSALGRSGYVFGLGEDVRVSDRFFLGGNNLRGFERSGVGPRDAATGDALGGNLFYSVTGELGFPIGPGSEIDLRGAFFVDAGSLAMTDDEGGGIHDEGSPRVSLGVGLVFRSPLGPIRLDFSRALVKEEFDETESFRFTFGTRL